MVKNVLFVLFLFYCFSCQKKSSSRNYLSLELINSHPQSIYLYKTAEGKDVPEKIDSVYINDLESTLNLKIPFPDHRVYQLIVSPYLPSIFFLNDTTDIRIQVNLNDFANYDIEGSNSNEEFEKLNKKIFPSINKLANSSIDATDRKNIETDIQKAYYESAKNSASPEFALFSAGNYNFNDGLSELQELMGILKYKFPNNMKVLKYIEASNKFIDTKSKEFNPGERLPSLEFRDILTGKNYKLSNDSNKIMVYDFFSVLQRTEKEVFQFNNLIQKFGKEKISVLSFPIDPDSTLVAQYLVNSNVFWPHFTDYLGWQGEIVPKYYIDSVPYLFITDFTGKIKYKNIPMFDLEAKISQIQK